MFLWFKCFRLTGFLTGPEIWCVKMQLFCFQCSWTQLVSARPLITLWVEADITHAAFHRQAYGKVFNTPATPNGPACLLTSDQDHGFALSSEHTHAHTQTWDQKSCDTQGALITWQKNLMDHSLGTGWFFRTKHLILVMKHKWGQKDRKWFWQLWLAVGTLRHWALKPRLPPKPHPLIYHKPRLSLCAETLVVCLQCVHSAVIVLTTSKLTLPDWIWHKIS